MADEKVLLDALACSGFKVSISDKKRIDALEVESIADTKRQLGEDPIPATALGVMKDEDSKSLLSIFKNMSASGRRNVIESLKQNGLSDPLSKEKIVQNSFTVEKIIRQNASN